MAASAQLDRAVTLKCIALAGQGRFFRADDTTAPRNALEQALTDTRAATPCVLGPVK